MEIKIVQKKDLVSAVQTFPLSPTIAILFGGERLMWADWGVIAWAGNEIAGMCSVGNQGEGSGEPTIIAVFVQKKYRRKGVGRQILSAAIKVGDRFAATLPVHATFIQSIVVNSLHLEQIEV